MICGICRHDNETSAKFCSECGAPLNLRCPTCDVEQPPGSKFCNQCGTAIGGSPEHHIVAARRSVAVRKQVTALFADLAGSTAFGEQVDPEAARAALAPYFEILQSTVEDHAGTVVKFTGDGVLAVFGVPEVAEDDALRAVAAGQALQDRFRAFAEQVRQRHGVELGLRVGVNTGELVVGDDDADIVGDVLNTAARLEATCTPGRVLVGEDTWRLTRSSIAYEVLGEVRVKGKADAIATFQLVAGTLGISEDVTPFVGRSAELETLRSVFADTIAANTARLVTVIGPPGVGKTRLAAELRGTSTARTFDLRFERRGSTTFTPIADLLRELTGSGSVEDVERLVADHPEAARLAPVLASFLSHGEARSTEESFWAIRRLFEQLAADVPVIIVVDDIQWAEPLFWDLLEHLVEWTQAAVLLVALARPEIRELRPDLARPGKRVTAAIDVEGLDAATTRELAARLLGTDELPADLIDRLPASTEGNPLFVRELVQMLVDDGVLARTGDRWHLTIDVDAIEVPPTILSLLASRVERLPDDERQVVELASVIGTEFDRGLLGSIAGAEVAGRLGALIDRLRRKDLVEPSGTWAGDHPVYRFHHVLVRDAAYRRLLKRHRADLHELVGRYLEDHIVSGDAGDVIVAHHYEQVHRYRSELGMVDEATQLLGERAMVRLRSAAEQALAREDLASSGSYAIRALALAGDGDERDELLVLGCEALLSSGDVARAAPLVDEFRSRQLDERLAAWADCFHAQLWSLTDSARLSEATDLADDAAARLDALDDPAGVAKARLVRASTLARLGRVGDCEAELDLALGAARAAGDRRRTVAVLGAAPLAALWGPSPVARAGGRCLDVLRLLRITTSSPAVEATSIRCQGMLEALRGRLDSARDKFETSRTTARDLGLRHGLYETELFEGFVELIAGDPVAAEPHLILARDGLGALGIGADAGQASALLARALLRQGRLDEADALATAALEAAGENLQTAVLSRSVLGEIRVEQGRPDEARQLIAAALAIVEQTDITIDHAIVRWSAARVADRLGDTQEAASHRAAAERLLADKGVTGLMEARPEHAVPTTSEPSTTAEDDETQQAAMLPPNAAWEVNEGLFATWVAGDRAGYLQLLAPDFQARIHELGPKLAFSGDRYATADVLFDSLAEDRTHAIPNRLIAKRGDDLALIAMTFQDGASSTTMYTVSQVRNGQVVRADTFAEDQLGEALDELDRRWVSLGAPADLVDGMKALRRSSADGDYARLRDLLADDFEVVAHGRLLLLDRRSADEFIESIRPLFGGGGVTTTIFADIPAITDRVALTRFHLDAVDGGGWRLWYLWIWGSGRLTRADIYELDAYDTALARFEELANAGGEPDTRPVADIVPGDHDHLDAETLTNTAWVVTQLAFEAGNIDDRHGYAALHSDRFETVDHERFTLEPGATMNRDDYVASVFDKEGLGADITAFGTLIAIRHDDLCLVTTTFSIDDYLMERLVIVQTEDRQIIRTDWFDHTDLPAALDHLDRRWAALGGPAEEVRLAIAFRGAQRAGDVEAARQLLHPDFVLTDHGRLGVGQLGIDDHLATAVYGAHGVVAIPIQYVVHTDSVALARIRFTTPDDSAWEHWVVTNIADGLTRSVDMFDLDDLEAAMSCYEELAAATPLDSATSRPVVVTPANAATRMIEEYTAALNDGDLDRFTAAFHPEVRQELRQRLRVADAIGNRGLADLGRSIIAGGGVLECEPVAIFGDQLAVCRQILRLGDDEIGECSVVEVDGGVITRVISFDDDQLVEALDTFDRRAVELGRPTALADTEITIRGAHWRHDVEAFREALDPSWSFHDHRRLGLGQMTHEQYLTSSFPTGPGEVLYWAVELLAHTDSVWLAHDRWLTAGGYRWDQLHVGVLRSGVGLSSDTFDLIDLDAARACYDERVTEAAGVPIDEPTHPGPATEGRPERGSSAFTNAAWAWSQACARAVETSDRSRLIELMADDLVAIARDRSNVGQELGPGVFADSLLARQADGSDTRLNIELIALRGDEFALVRLDWFIDDNLMEFLIVNHVVDGLAKRMVMFDPTQLMDALDELDRQWAEHGGPARVLEHTVALRRAIHDGDTEAARAVLSPAFQAVDRRRLGLPTLDLDAYLAAPKGGSGTQLLVVDVARHADDASLERIQVNLDDGWSTMEMWAVISLDGHGIATIDNYDIDDADAAHARFDDLTSEVPVSHPRPFSNRA